MKKRIFLLLTLFSAVFMLASTALVGTVYYRFYQNSVKGEIRTECKMLAKTLDAQPDNPAFLNYFKSVAHPDTRITLVDKTGRVLFDTSGDASVSPNHADRQEIMAALEFGTGESVRHSSTLRSDNFYFAARLNNDDVLRLSRPIDRIFAMFEDTVSIVLFLLLVLIALSLFFASLLTSFLMKPVNALAARLDAAISPTGGTAAEVGVYEELSPFLQKINSLRGQVGRYTQSLREEKDTFATITKNMREGLILLDTRKNVLTINRSALRMLGLAKGQSYEGQSLLHLKRSLPLTEALDSVLTKGGARSTDEQDGHGNIYRFFVSPVPGEDDAPAGAMVFIVDVTIEAQSEKIRRDFAANVSHELKTPLTSICGFAEMIENGMMKSEEDIHTSAARIRRESSRLIALIEDIIRLSEIETGTTIEMGVCRLDSIVREAAQSLETPAAEREVTIVQDCKEIIVLGSRSMLYELVYNLLENAVKYNIPGGSVTASLLKKDDGAVLLTVSDTGIGIAGEHLARIFERFYRVDKSRSKQTGGTGLGLSIVKHIVEVHGGQVSVQSKEKAGTTITVLLPAQKPALPA